MMFRAMDKHERALERVRAKIGQGIRDFIRENFTLQEIVMGHAAFHEAACEWRMIGDPESSGLIGFYEHLSVICEEASLIKAGAYPRFVYGPSFQTFDHNAMTEEKLRVYEATQEARAKAIQQ